MKSLIFWRFGFMLHWGCDIFELLPILRICWGRNGIYENQYAFQVSWLRLSFQIIYDKDFTDEKPI